VDADRDRKAEAKPEGWCALWERCGVVCGPVVVAGCELCRACWLRTEGRVPGEPKE
jgi:hypothetical protein